MRSDQLKLPPQHLAVADVDRFLEYLFSAIARRPARLNVREGIRVARYLRGLAWEAKPGPRRVLLERLASMIWRQTLQFAPAGCGLKEEVLAFLERHAGTYLAAFDVGELVQDIRESPAPATSSMSLRPPGLLSPYLSERADGPLRRRDDLSERIYAAYYGLRRAGVPGARNRIAEALNRHGLKMSGPHVRSPVWGPGEVYERAKQYQRSFQRRFKDRAQALVWRQGVVDKWVAAFGSFLTVAAINLAKNVTPSG
jgi:hypothetical protein